MIKEILESGQSRLLTAGQLITLDFNIPPFQRPYDWGKVQVDDFIQDLADAQSKDIPLFLGLVVLCPCGDGEYAIIDGQQRLTTLMLAIGAQGETGQVLRSESGSLSKLWVTPRRADIGFARALISMNKEGEQTLSQRKMAEAFDLLRGND